MAEQPDFIDWWIEAEQKLLRFAYRYMQNADSARDLVQDISILAIRNIDRLHSREEFQKWAFRRLWWFILDARIFRKREVQYDPGILDQEIRYSNPPNQEYELLIKEITELIKKLPPMQQNILQGILMGFSTKELGKYYEIKEGSVRSLYRFAREGLIRLLDQEQGYNKENMKNEYVRDTRNKT